MPFNRLTPPEAEWLALLAEECAEVIQAVGKILRHGYASHNPLISGDRNNRDMLEAEIGHVQAAVTLMMDSGDVYLINIESSAERKAESVRTWLHHQTAMASPLVSATKACASFEPPYVTPDQELPATWGLGAWYDIAPSGEIRIYPSVQAAADDGMRGALAFLNTRTEKADLRVTDDRGLEVRLAKMLAKVVDATLLTVGDPDGSARRHHLRLACFQPELAEEAAGLLEEAGY